MSARLPVSYVLPLRWTDDAGLPDLTDYLRQLAAWVEVTVVDGSPAPLFERHAAAWRGLVRHVPVAPRFAFVNGKVNGVLTGLALAGHDHVVIADDDVRWDRPGLVRLTGLLDRAELVRPQSYFDPVPWHARWDTGRTLLNRALGADYPGTFGVRRSFFAAMGGYDGDVLFENLEMIRTVRANGGRELRPLDLYVRRLPPETARFWGQRVRQAYDDLAQPGRLALFLAVLPGLGAALAARRPGIPLAAAAGVAGLAEAGRRRAGGRRVFPASASLLAPVWLLERGVCAWLAVGARVTRGGVVYTGRRVRVAAHSRRELRRRATDSASVARVGLGGDPEPAEPVGAVTERLEAGAPAAAQRDGAAARLDHGAVLGDDLEPAPHQERAVLAGDDRRAVVRRQV
jgi:hypothetical protein